MSLFPKFKTNLDSVATPATSATSPLQSSKSSESSSSPTIRKNDRYRQTAEAVLSDCEAIDANWLADHYPQLWRRMAMIDMQLTRLEQRNTEPAEYEAMLEKLVQTVQQARILYETERQQQESRGAEGVVQ